jgi:hypothetical protein
MGPLRRISCDGKALWHVQLGVWIGPDQIRDLSALHTVIDECLALPVRLAGAAAPGRPLLSQRKALATLIERSTTPRIATATNRPLRTGTPLIYVESATRAGIGASAWMPGGQSLSDGITMFRGHWPLNTGDATMVWMEYQGTPRARRNSMRVNLLRLHAEREVVKQVLYAAPSMRTPTPELERFLARAHSLFTQGSRFGIDQQELKAAFAAYDDFTAAERAAILDLLAEKQQSRGRANDLVDALQRNGPMTLNVFQEGARMSTINISGSGNTFGQINVETTFTNSTAIVNQAPTGPIKDALEKMLEQAKQLALKLPEEQREDVAKNTEALAREAASKKPNAGILSISAKGLIEAAKTVAEMAKPIATAVGAVLGILGIVL